MNKYHYQLFLILVSLGVLLTACSTVDIGDVQVKETSVALQDEQLVDISIRLGMGDLTVTGNQEKKIQAEVSYNVESLEPIFDYTVDGEKVGIWSFQQSNMNVPIGNVSDLSYDSSIILPMHTPLKLYLKAGAGTNELNLQELNLVQADIISGVGETTINLDGTYNESVTVNIESGVGKTTIITPASIGVVVYTDSGIGETATTGLIQQEKGVYVNEAYESTGEIMEINLKMGVGDVEIIKGSM